MRLDQDRRDVGCLQHREAGLLDPRLVQASHPADLSQHLAAELQAVLDLRGGAHVEQRARHGGVVRLDVDAAHQVGGVLLVGHPARGGAAGCAVAQGEHRRAARLLVEEGVGVDRHEQVGLHAPRLAHPLVQRHEEVGVSGEHGAHAGMALMRSRSCIADLQHHVLLAQPARAGRAGILAAVARVDRDDDRGARPWLLACDGHRSRGRRRGPGAGVCSGAGERPGAVATRGFSSLPMNSPSASATACAACCSALSFSWISASSGSRSCTGYRSNTRRCW
jgi:hypothetical protein